MLMVIKEENLLLKRFYAEKHVKNHQKMMIQWKIFWDIGQMSKIGQIQYYQKQEII